jgi:hypothetical protein
VALRIDRDRGLYVTARQSAVPTTNFVSRSVMYPKPGSGHVVTIWIFDMTVRLNPNGFQPLPLSPDHYSNCVCKSNPRVYFVHDRFRLQSVRARISIPWHDCSKALAGLGRE